MASSSMASSGISPLATAMNLLAGRLAGGDGKLAAKADRLATLLEDTCRRPPPTIGMGAVPSSFRAAATAATLAALLVMDFLRVTRLLPLMGPGPTRSECELVREWDCLDESPDDVADSDGRCVNGREDCCISCHKQFLVMISVEVRTRFAPVCGRQANRAGMPDEGRDGVQNIPWKRPLPATSFELGYLYKAGRRHSLQEVRNYKD